MVNAGFPRSAHAIIMQVIPVQNLLLLAWMNQFQNEQDGVSEVLPRSNTFNLKYVLLLFACFAGRDMTWHYKTLQYFETDTSS